MREWENAGMGPGNATNAVMGKCEIITFFYKLCHNKNT